jgi:ABC-2 type transport system ATP-binding protein
MIRVESLSKRFGELQAVADVSFHVRKGEVFGFLGPNGAGKTTTMRIIAGLIEQTSGSVHVGGHDLRKEPLQAKAITSYIPDRPYLYEKLTAMELLELVGGLNDVAPAEVVKRALELLDTFGLAAWEDALIETFSHGMKQRLVFVAALLTRPQLLVIDEPMVGLDPRGTRLVKRVFRELCDSEELTVFLSTHTLEVAEEVCDRIAIINGGRIVALGTMEQLRSDADRPGSRLEDIFLKLTEEAEVEP